MEFVSLEDAGNGWLKSVYRLDGKSLFSFYINLKGVDIRVLMERLTNITEPECLVMLMKEIRDTGGEVTMDPPLMLYGYMPLKLYELPSGIRQEKVTSTSAKPYYEKFRPKFNRR